MKYLSLLLLLLLFGCGEGEKTQEVKPNYSDNQFHPTDLRISKGENLLAEGSPLASYEEEQGLFLQSLHDMAIDPETKDLYLIEAENDHIIKLGSSGTPLLKLSQKELLNSFSIQQGQEWEASVEGEKGMKGYPIRIRDVCITSEGDMLVGWGGPFKDEISIGMRFSSEGEFLGRIFSNEQLAYVPSHMVLENDSTLWVQNLTTYQLFRTHLRPAHEQPK